MKNHGPPYEEPLLLHYETGIPDIPIYFDVINKTVTSYSYRCR